LWNPEGHERKQKRRPRYKKYFERFRACSNYMMTGRYAQKGYEGKENLSEGAIHQSSKGVKGETNLETKAPSW